MLQYFIEIKGKIKNWWVDPITKSYRISSSLMGMWAGLWLACLLLLVFEGQTPIDNIGVFAIYGIILGGLSGAIFPKISRMIFLPFIFFIPTCS